MLCYPDYNRSVIGIISSIMSYYRAPFEYPVINVLDNYLGKFYKNVVFIDIEGMGTDMLEHNLDKKSFLRKNYVQNLTSVFPSTTAASLTSLMTGVSPAEHGWLGKSLFFKEFCRMIDVYTNLDAYTNQTVSIGSAANFVMPYETIYESIKKSIIDNVQPFTIAPAKFAFSERGNIHKTSDDIYRVCDLITKIAQTNQNTFTFVYWNGIDETAHKTGCYSDETFEQLKLISGVLGKTFESLTDTLFIISAGHGMTDISAEMLVDRMPELTECLIMPPLIGSRAMSFFVKPDRRADFENAFAERIGHDFMLISRSDLYDKELLGTGKIHKKVYDFIGDYVACGVSDTELRYRTLNMKPRGLNKASHGGITEQEMTVPLIIAATERTKEYKQRKIL